MIGFGERRRPLRVVSHKVELRGRTLRWLIEYLDKRHTDYLSGEMMVGSKLERVEDLDRCGLEEGSAGAVRARPRQRDKLHSGEPHRPADFDGKVLRLHYARAKELGPYLGLMAAQGRCNVQVWLIEAVSVAVSALVNVTAARRQRIVRRR